MKVELETTCIGIAASSVGAYQRSLARPQQHDVDCAPLRAAQKTMRGVQGGVSMNTPWGVLLELVHGLADATSSVGAAEDYEASRRFAINDPGLNRLPTATKARKSVMFSIRKRAGRQEHPAVFPFWQKTTSSLTAFQTTAHIAQW